MTSLLSLSYLMNNPNSQKKTSTSNKESELVSNSLPSNFYTDVKQLRPSLRPSYKPFQSIEKKCALLNNKIN